MNVNIRADVTNEGEALKLIETFREKEKGYSESSEFNLNLDITISSFQTDYGYPQEPL